MNAKQKDELQAATRRHVELDMLIRGTYGEMRDSAFKGCSVGCLAHDHGSTRTPHKVVAERYGYDIQIVELQDYLFENVSTDIHVMLADTIQPREDWESVIRIIYRRILEEIVLPAAGKSSMAVQQVIDLYRRESTDTAAWDAAQDAAEAASASAAQAGAQAAARAAGWAATEAASASAAPAAPRAAARAAGRAAGRAAAGVAAGVAARDAAQAAGWAAARGAGWAAARDAAEAAANQKIMQIVLEEIGR